MAEQFFIGIDVGTSSARAGIFDAAGNLRGAAKHAITTWREAGDIVEQSSADIWSAVCACVRDAVAASAIAPEAVAGIGFAATCSLVVVRRDGSPLPVGPSGDANRNVIVWMDHRAAKASRGDQRQRATSPERCRRHDIARDGDAKTALAAAEHARRL